MRQLIVFGLLGLLAVTNAYGQQNTRARLEESIRSAQCFVDAMKAHADINRQEWAVARTGNNSANRGIEPIRIEHPCSKDNPSYGFYTHEQVVNNIRVFSAAIKKWKRELQYAP